MKITDGKAFREEVALRLSKGEKTNFFMTEEVYLPLISADEISRFDFHGGVYFFWEQRDKIELFYFLERGKQPVRLPKFGLPLILEEVILATKERIPSEASWIAAGFTPYLTRKRLYLSSNKVKEQARMPAFATLQMAEEIKILMDKSFDPFTSELPELAVLEDDIRQRRVLVYSKEERLLGFLRFGPVKQGQMLWQIAVKEEAKGKGIADFLVRDWLWLEKENTKKFMLWVRLDNPPALKLYDKLGFIPDGRIGPVMIKRERKEDEKWNS